MLGIVLSDPYLHLKQLDALFKVAGLKLSLDNSELSFQLVNLVDLTLHHLLGYCDLVRHYLHLAFVRKFAYLRI